MSETEEQELFSACACFHVVFLSGPMCASISHTNLCPAYAPMQCFLSVQKLNGKCVPHKTPQVPRKM